MIEDHLKLKPGQTELTPEQQAEAQRFAAERIAAQLSTEPVDEQEAEAFLRHAYRVAKLPPPTWIHWLDGPVPFVALFIPPRVEDSIWARVRDSVLASGWRSVRDSVWYGVENSVQARVEASIEDSGWRSVWDSVWGSIEDSVLGSVRHSIEDNVRHSVEASIEDSVRHNSWTSVQANVEASVWTSVLDVVMNIIRDSVRAYYEASRLAFYHFFDVYLAPNELHALAHFNELVSGYWLGKDVAVIVRRPHLLSCDAEGRLHSTTGKCVEYHDGWGISAWHGVGVPEKVIMDPDGLRREDFLSEPNVEVRRVIQERMGQRFVSELGGKVLEQGPRETLYEVALPGDPERIARYVWVQDASTSREYFLRVPPTIQTAAEAVAWSFKLSVEEYGPAHET